jgi:death on curing protein
MRHVTISELVYINGTILKNQKILNGTQEIRDMALLDAAAARPAASAFGEDAYPTLRQKVAALFHSIVRNHPFTDGNKRTATVGAIFMFAVNGQCVMWQTEDALSFILEVAEGRTDVDRLAEWFPLTPGDSYPEPDAERDMKLIASIVTQYKDLLDELEKR